MLVLVSSNVVCLEQKEIALAHQTIEGPNFSLTLSQWTNEYHSEVSEWNTQVSLEMKGITQQPPPRAGYQASSARYGSARYGSAR